jgi:hypothetical protein
MHRTVIAALLATAGVALAQQPRSAVEEIERYRAALGDGNPAELWEARGEVLWKQKGGPKNASLEQCDLGLGPGVVKGAYTVLPKYFKDTDKVEDLESRLVSCMVNLQGFTPEQAKKDPFGGPGKKVPMDALVAYITSESRGIKMNVQAAHRRRSRRTSWAARCSISAADRTISPAPLPWRRQPAHPTAGSSESYEEPTRRRPTPPGRRTASRRAKCARSNGASTTASPAALPRARVRVARFDRAHHVSREKLQRRHVRRPVHQALRRRYEEQHHDRCPRHCGRRRCRVRLDGA